MFSLWNILRIVVYFGSVSCRWATPGYKSIIDGNATRCYSEMEQNSDISHLLLDVTDSEKISHFCSRITFLKKCVAKFEHQLTNSQNADYLLKTHGISAFYINVCPPGTDITEKYKKNAHCFQLIKTKILSCGSDLPDMSSYKMKNDLNARCCALKKHRECMSWAAADECGKDAEEVIEKILIRYFGPQLEGCRDSHFNSCQQGIHTKDPTPDDQDSVTRLHGDSDHHSKDEDWTRTTIAEEWKKHKLKHNSGEKASVSFWSVVGSLVVLLLNFT